MRKRMIYVGTRTVLAKTCHDCERLKSGNDFPTVQNGAYLSTVCRECLQVRTKKASRAANEASRAGATRANYIWTDTEIWELQKCLQQGMSGKQIAARLNRTIVSIYGAKRKYGRDI